MLCRAWPIARATRIELNSSELLRNSAAGSPFYELDVASDENSRGKVQNVVGNSTAKSLRGESYRFHPSRMFGPCDHLVRAALETHSARLLGLLSRLSDASIARSQLADSTVRGSTGRWTDHCHSEGRRTPSPVPPSRLTSIMRHVLSGPGLRNLVRDGQHQSTFSLG